VELVDAHSKNEGTTLEARSAIHFYRVSEPCKYRKVASVTPRLIVVAQGKKIGQFPEGELIYDENHFLVVTAETPFEGYVLEASPSRPYLAMCVELGPEIIARTLLALADGDGPPRSGTKSLAPAGSRALPAFVAPLDEPFANALIRILSALGDPLERKILLPLAMEELVFRLLRTDAAAVLRSAIREGDSSIRTAMAFIRANASNALTVEGVARHVGMSSSHFAHRFSEVARVSPMRFLKHVRLEAARELILSGNVRIGETASRVGYESASHFTRDFKVAYGASPAEYARRVREDA
jgi:AraC-like DNA-binding protein